MRGARAKDKLDEAQREQDPERRAELEAEAAALMAEAEGRWGAQGTARLVLHTLVGGAVGGAAGAAGGGGGNGEHTGGAPAAG